jgi:hypothetical protein
VRQPRIVRRLSENLAEVPDGKTTSHVLGVLAHLLDPDASDWVQLGSCLYLRGDHRHGGGRQHADAGCTRGQTSTPSPHRERVHQCAKGPNTTSGRLASAARIADAADG